MFSTDEVVVNTLGFLFVLRVRRKIQACNSPYSTARCNFTGAHEDGLQQSYSCSCSYGLSGGIVIPGHFGSALSAFSARFTLSMPFYATVTRYTHRSQREEAIFHFEALLLVTMVIAATILKMSSTSLTLLCYAVPPGGSVLVDMLFRLLVWNKTKESVRSVHSMHSVHSVFVCCTLMHDRSVPVLVLLHVSYAV